MGIRPGNGGKGSNKCIKASLMLPIDDIVRWTDQGLMGQGHGENTLGLGTGWIYGINRGINGQIKVYGKK